MTEPHYVGLQKNDIPELKSDNGRVRVSLISGSWDGATAVLVRLTDVNLSSLHLKQGGRLRRDVTAGRSIFFYVVKGELMVNGERVVAQFGVWNYLVSTSQQGTRLKIGMTITCFRGV